MTLDELKTMLRRACDESGTVAAWCGVHGVSSTVVGRVLSGRETPGPKLLTAMGMVRVVTYEPVVKEPT